MTASRRRLGAALPAMLIAALIGGVAARADELVAFSTAKARATALGGAYFSAEDDLFSALWNPASFGDPRYLQRREIGLYLMPATPAMAVRAYRTRDAAWNRDGRLTESEAILSALSVVKGLSLGWRTWMLGFVNVDEPLRPRPTSEPMLSGWNGTTGRSYTVALAFKLAPQVVLGGAAKREVRADEAASLGHWGGSFGVLLRPSAKVNIGLTYVARPDELIGLAEELERVDSGTINGGVSWYPWTGAAWLVDVRNLDNSEGRFGFAEVHVGMEQTFYHIVSFRGGWYRIREDRTDVYSGGIGIKAPWLDPDPKRPGRRGDVVSYTFVRQHGVDWDRRWHMLALTIPLEW